MVTTTTGLATSFIQFSRTSNATVTGADGRIKWAGHNLLTNSESFDASAWVKITATVSANTSVAPNGSTTADTLTISTDSFVYQVVTLSPASHVLAAWVRAPSGTVVFRFTYYNGSTSVFSPNLTATTDWQLFTFNITGSGVLGNVGITTASGSPATVIAWGAHLYRSDLGGMVLNPARGDAYYPTTPRNLLGFTEDFSNAAWAAVTNATVVSNIANGPNGLATADLIYPSSSGSNRQRYQTVAGQVSGTRYTVSVYLKAASMQWIAMLSPNGANYGAYFDLVNGVKGTEASGVTATITSVGDGWYRCSVSQVSSGTTIYCGISFADANGGTTVTASGTSGVYAWGAQLSDSASLDAYSPVYGAAVTSAAYYAPRLDYSGSSLAALGLLVEEQRTNISLHSNDFSQSAWTKINLTNVTTKTTGPDAVTDSGTLLNEDTVNSEHGVSQTFSKAASATTYTLSCFAKVGVGRTRITMAGYSNTESGNGTFAPFDLSGGQTGSLSNRGSGWAGSTSSITPVGNGWYRCTLTVTTSTGTDIVFQILNDSGSGTATQARAYAGTVGNGCYIYGAQLEAGSFATSYIPTGASTATRTADVASVSTQAFPYSASEGTLVGEVRGLLSSTITQVPLVNFGDANNRIELRAVGDPFTYNRAVVVNSGSTVVDINATGLPASASATRKVGFAFKLNDFATTGTGGTVGTTSSGTIPSVSVMNIGTAPYSASLKTNGWIASITYLPRRISNSELQARTV